MGMFKDLFGTVKSYFRIGLTGPRLKNNGGALNVRNAGDSADAAITAGAATLSGALTATVANLTGETVTINSDAAGAGADWAYALTRPTSGMTAAVTLTLPVDDGTNGQVLQTNGTGTLSWASAGSTADLDHYETTSLAFGSGATVSMFTLPAGAVISHIEIVIDTAFDGTGPTPSMSVGINGGSASKYVAATEVDLTMAAATVFDISPGLPAPGGTEALEIAFTAGGGASAGAARAIVHYANPA